MQLKDVAIWIGILSDFSELIPLCIFLYVGAQKKGSEFRLLGVFFVFTSLLKIATVFLALRKINNMPLYHLLAIIELLFIFLYYDKLLYPNRSRIAFLFVLLLFNILDTLLFENIYTFNSFSWSINIVVLLSLGLMYYYHLYKNMEGIQIETYPNFFITAGFLVYTSGSFFTYLLSWKILSKAADDFFHNGWLIHSAANFVKNLAVGYGLWLTRQN